MVERLTLNCLRLAVLFAVALNARAASQVAVDLPNLDFEKGIAGELPPGWHVQSASGGTVTAVIDSDRPQSGHASLLFSMDSKAPYGAVATQIDATPWRGKLALIHLYVRSTLPPDAMTAVSAGPESISGHYYPSDDVVLPAAKAWTPIQMIVNVPDDAERLTIGLSQYAAGQTSLDNIRIEPVEAASVGWEGQRPLTARALLNLHAFARLLGYVRFYHPSDQVAAADWGKVAIAGVEHVENAANDHALVAALRDVFEPLAPTLRIFETGQAQPPPSAALSPVKGGVVIGWRNEGVDLASSFTVSRSFYHSTRAEMSDRKPDQTFEADLGGGASILMPVRLYKDDKGTLPHVAMPTLSYTKPIHFEPSGRDRSTRLADVMLAWNVYQQFYPDYEEQPADLPAALDNALQSAATDRDETAFRSTLFRLSAVTKDGHGFIYYDHQSELYLPIKWRWLDGQLVILTAPADSGLKPGDIVDRVGGRPIADIVAELKPLTPAPSPLSVLSKLSWRISIVPERNPVAIDAHRPGTANVHALVKPVADTDGNEFNALKPVTELQPGIWYVDLRRVSDAEFNAKMSVLAQAKAIILDDRGYPVLGVAQKVIAHLSGWPIYTQDFEKPITTVPDHQDINWEPHGYALQPVAPKFSGKFVLLTNVQATSFGEMIAGMFDDNHLGTIVGSATFGVDGDINPFTLPGGYQVSWTGMRARRYGGRRFIGIGILPNVFIMPTAEGIRAGRDEVLEKGIEVVSRP